MAAVPQLADFDFERTGTAGLGQLDCDASQTTEPTIQSAEPTSPMGAWSVHLSAQKRPG